MPVLSDPFASLFSSTAEFARLEEGLAPGSRRCSACPPPGAWRWPCSSAAGWAAPCVW